MLNAFQIKDDILMTEYSDDREDENEDDLDLDLELNPNYTADWKLNPNAPCQVTLERLKILPSKNESYRCRDSEVNVRSVESCDMYFKMEQLVDELLNAYAKCEDKCGMCDKYITQVHRHLIRDHARSPTTNLGLEKVPSIESLTEYGIIPNQIQMEPSILHHHGTTEYDDKVLNADVAEDIKSHISLIDPSLASLEHVNHFSLMEANLKQEPDDEVCQEDPLLNIDEASNLISNDDLDSTENLVSCDEGQLPVTPGEIEQTATHSMNSDEESTTFFIQTCEKLERNKCSTCGNSYSTRRSLVRHELSHTGESRFKCDVCGKFFTCSVNLIIHQRTHTGVRPFRCSACGNYFITERNLETHKRRMHFGKGNVKCDVCGKSFSWSAELIVHQKSHRVESVQA